MPVTVGSTAPDFNLFASMNEPVQLSQFKGEKNVLLLFFPQSFTGVCTKELCSVRDDIARYQEMNAEVIGISVDSVFTLARFKEDQSLNFTLLSDFNREATQAYDCMYDSFTPMGMKGVSKRSAFIIDKAGIVRYAEVLDNAGEIPNFDAIHTCLNSLNG
jgi:peroxiredoxin